MNSVNKGIEQAVGHTPLVELACYCRQLDLGATLLAKVEGMNPAGSIKDRAARFMLDDAEQKGLLRAGSVIIEPTSGNTGIGLASLAAARGYKVVLTMPDTMSIERRSLLAAFGAQLVLTDGAKGMAGAIEKANELAAQTPGSFIPGQFVNPANPAAHYATTGPEIWQQTGGNIDCFVAGVGTGGTITGTGRYLREQKPDIHIVAVEPASSPVLSQGKAGPHGIQGIGAGFVPDILDTDIYNEIIAVADQDAYSTGRQLAQTEGVLAGISSGAALWAASQLAASPQYAGAHIVVILPDTGDRYLSTPMFSQ